MAKTVRLFKRGLNILTTEGPVELLSRFAGFGAYLIESEYYGRIAKRNSPYEYHGVALPLDMNVFDNRVRHAFVTDSYEATEIELIDEYVTGSYDLVDLGASTGFTTVYGLSKLDERARGIAVEANPEMILVMESVREMNDVKFDIESAAYDPEQSEVDFHVHDKTVSSSTERQGGSKMTIPTVSMADIVAKHDIEEFVCLVDIEGGEIGLVQEELKLLEETCAIIIIEIHEMDGIATETKHQMADSEFELADTSGDVYVYLNDAF